MGGRLVDSSRRFWSLWLTGEPNTSGSFSAATPQSPLTNPIPDEEGYHKQFDSRGGLVGYRGS